MQNQCFKLQGSGYAPEVGGEASATDVASGHFEAARTFQPSCRKALVSKSSRAFDVKRIKNLFIEDHVFRLSLLLAPKMVTHAIMEGELSTSAAPPVDTEQSELLSLTVSGPDDQCLRSPDSVTSILPDATINGGLLAGTVNETYEGSIKDGSVDLDEKDHSDIILTLDGESAADPENYSTESLQSLVFQVFIPFLVAGFGTVAAGFVLDTVQEWPVFENVSQLFILVPALLGLKGNLEMTLAARISTQANLGQLDSLREQWKMTYGNMALVQCQATIVAFLAAVFAIVVDIIQVHSFDVHHATLICASSLLTASVASLILGFITVGVVLLSRRMHINPDNVATPIAASLGDVTTLALLACISSSLYNTILTDSWIAPLLIAIFIIFIPIWIIISFKNKYTKKVLYHGWIPVISAVLISSVGGCVLDLALESFSGMAIYQPVINGVGGNLVAVQASRISTYLHQRSQMGTLPLSDSKACVNPCFAFFGKSGHSRSARVLLLMALPGHLIFAYAIRLLKTGSNSLTPLFLLVYLSSAIIQVSLLLYIAHCMIQWMWKKKIDPDNSAIPYLTALGDLLGTSLLAVAFVILAYAGDIDVDVHE